MSEDFLDSSTPDALWHLLHWGAKNEKLFDDGELGDLLAHYLGSPPDFNVSPDAPDVPPDPFTLRQRPTTGQILLDPNAALPMLHRINVYADVQRHHPERPLPDEIAVILYLGSAAAALRIGHRITNLDDAALAAGFRWAVRQSWLSPPIASLLQTALQNIQNTEDEEHRPTTHAQASPADAATKAPPPVCPVPQASECGDVSKNSLGQQEIASPGPQSKKLVMPWTSLETTVPGPLGGPPVGAPIVMNVRLGPSGRNGSSIRPLREVLPKAHWGFSNPPVAAAEANCTVKENGVTKKQRGAYLDPFKIVAFIGCPAECPNPPPVHPGKGPLKDWHGHMIGRWWIAEQLVPHTSANTEYPIVMDVGGRRYCGKGDGVGHICRGERVPSQKTQAQQEHAQYAAASSARKSAPPSTGG